MAFVGETIASGAPERCPDCDVTPKLQVLHTCAYYIGTHCNCGPYSRESDYFKTREEAQRALDHDPLYAWARET